ncbi:MAG: TetR/AcrR family transcriptional regulator [Pseudomonadota bacterium]
MKHFSEMSESALRVVDAAEGLIQERGYNGFSYDDVAKLVGIKKPSIHHHFATKGDLATAVAQRYTHRFREQLLRIEVQHAKAQDRLTAYATLFENTFAAEQRLCVCGMLGAEAKSLPDGVAHEVSRFFEANTDWLAMVIAEGQRAQQLRAQPEARALADAFLATLEGAMIVARSVRGARGPAGVAQTYLSTLLA